MPVVQAASQYIQSDKDNVAVVPQPGDVEITDVYGNKFDNINEYGEVTGEDKSTAKNRLVAFFDKDNVALNPQPAYQNLGYRKRKLECGNLPPGDQPLPDAGDYVFSGLIPGTTRTPEPYVRSPLFPGGVPLSRTISTFVVVLQEEASEALIVAENDVNDIRLEVNPANFASIRDFVASE